MAAARPILHVLAGPNGAGKSSLYASTVSRLTDAEFVNPDLLAAKQLGHHAQTEAEARLGQALADARRADLMSQRQSLVTESTFSHPSKLELIETARAAGFEIAVYHVNLASADLAVARVEQRTRAGGHPVPEDRIRGRYDRNQAIIRQAILEADNGYVFDNSLRRAPARPLIHFRAGRPRRVALDLPDWAIGLYGGDIEMRRRSPDAT